MGSDNGLSSGRRQAIIWASARLLLIGPLRIYLSEIFIKIKIVFIEENDDCKQVRQFVSASMC